jgi:hypothetical protein
MRTIIIVALFLFVGYASSRFERGTVIKKEELRGLPNEIYQTILANAVHDVVERVIISAQVKNTQYIRNICDSAQFMSDDRLKDYSDAEILVSLKSSLVDSELKITRSYCSGCPRTGYKMETNCRILLVEW